VVLAQPVGHPLKIAGKGTTLADRFLGAVFANGHEVKNWLRYSMPAAWRLIRSRRFRRTFALLLGLVGFFLCHTYLGFLVAGLFFF
jgi:hypothetical protein